MNLKAKYNKDFKILQLDGGGLRGIIFLSFLVELETKLQKPCYDLFDLMIGTSTGGISASLLSAGYTAQEVLDFYITNSKKIFNKRFLGMANPLTWITGSRYRRKFIDNIVQKMLPMDMSKLKTDLILTGVNMRDARHTHYFKSYKEKYKDVPVCFPVMATYSAPTYLGYFKDTKDELKTYHPKGGIWSDGGVGVENCTLLQAYIEAKRSGVKNKYWILSCGTGYTGLTTNKTSMISQVKDFMPVASEQSISMQVSHCEELGVNFTRIDTLIEKKYDKMDKSKYINKYIEYGKRLAEIELREILKK